MHTYTLARLLLRQRRRARTRIHGRYVNPTGFSVIVMLAVEYGCQALGDTEGLAQHLGNTTAHILQQRLDETGMMGYLCVNSKP